jgi:hypothetical protein
VGGLFLLCFVVIATTASASHIASNCLNGEVLAAAMIDEQMRAVATAIEARNSGTRTAPIVYRLRRLRHCEVYNSGVRKPRVHFTQ